MCYRWVRLVWLFRSKFIWYVLVCMSMSMRVYYVWYSTMHCTELQIGFYISDQSLYGIFGFIFGLVCPVYTYTCRKLLALMPETFHFCYMRKLLTVWMVAFYDHVVLLCIGMSDHFWSLCISMCRLYTYKYKMCVRRFVFHIQNHSLLELQRFANTFC